MQQNINWFNYQGFYDFVVAEHPEFSKFVELGVWKGDSTSYIARQLNDTDQVYAIDLFDEWQTDNETALRVIPNIYNMFLDTINRAQVTQRVTPIKSISWEAAKQFEDESVDVVYIDADHSYESVVNDIEAWLPKIKQGGIIAGHDAGFSPVIKAARQCLKNITVRHDWGNTWYTYKQ